MHILLVTQYFKPESIGSPIWVHQLAVDLVTVGHHVTVVTAFPNYPDRIIFEGYRGKVFQREQLDGVEVQPVPVVLNTSFNENEPIVCNPQEALDCFLRTKMDVLVLGNFFIKRKS